jgi:hypothetical protein
MTKTKHSLFPFSRKRSWLPARRSIPRTQACLSLSRNQQTCSDPPGEYPSAAKRSRSVHTCCHLQYPSTASFVYRHCAAQTVRCLWKQIRPQHEASRCSQCSTAVGNTWTVTSTPLLHTSTRRDSSIHDRVWYNLYVRSSSAVSIRNTSGNIDKSAFCLYRLLILVSSVVAVNAQHQLSACNNGDCSLFGTS